MSDKPESRMFFTERSSSKPLKPEMSDEELATKLLCVLSQEMIRKAELFDYLCWRSQYVLRDSRAALQNPHCDNDKCTSPSGEVRVLPTGGDGNAILCHACYAHELGFRQERNITLSPDCQFDLPQWTTLKVYENNV